VQRPWERVVRNDSSSPRVEAPVVQPVATASHAQLVCPSDCLHSCCSGCNATARRRSVC
jgi:hypothetical protein